MDNSNKYQRFTDGDDAVAAIEAATEYLIKQDGPRGRLVAVRTVEYAWKLAQHNARQIHLTDTTEVDTQVAEMLAVELVYPEPLR